MKKIFTIFCFTFSVIFILSCETETAMDKNNTGKTNPNDNNIVELSPDDIKPAFTRETVIKLNTIVSKQLELVNEFDRVKKSYDKNNDVGKEELSEYKGTIFHLMTQAKENKREILDAKAKLDQSGESYNGPTLAGMMDFIKDVEKEITSYHSNLEG